MTSSGCRLPLPSFVLAQENVTVGAVVFSHSELARAERDEGTRDTAASVLAIKITDRGQSPVVYHLSKAISGQNSRHFPLDCVL